MTLKFFPSAFILGETGGPISKGKTFANPHIVKSTKYCMLVI